MTSKHAIVLAGLLGLSTLAGCGDEETKVVSERGLPPGAKKIDAPAGKPPAGKAPAESGSRRSKSGPAEPAPEELEPVRPDRPRAVISREDFGAGARDPFHTYVSQALETDPVPVEVLDRQRIVKLAEYDFEELKLIAIVNAGRNVEPRALFLSAQDNKSKTVRQGELFSSAEVLLASVNRDYIEVEVVDPELTPSWNLERGERRVIYLKDPGRKN